MFKKSKQVYAILILLVSIVFISCAKEGLPPGGPVDMIPPRVISNFPATNSTKINTDTYIEIQFSETMDKEKTDSSIFISPVTEEPFKYKWKGKKLVIKPTKLLEKNKTYVIAVGTGASDIHENHLTKPYSFAFSTGETVDQGEIDGSVFSSEEATARISVWAFQMDNRDNPNPAVDMPEYITQPDNAGNYKMQYISLGKYRLYAVGDVNDNLKWDVDEEPIGVSSGDVILTADQSSKTGCNFVISKRDTVGPSLLTCQLLDNEKLQLELDEEPDSISLFKLDNYRIVCENDNSESIKVNCVYFPTNENRKPCLSIEPLKPKTNYKLTIDGLTDKWSNKINNSFDSCAFSGTDKKDTIFPTILFSSVRDRESAVPLDAKLEFRFSEPMNRQSIEESFFVKDTNGTRVNGSINWFGCASFAFVPQDSLKNSLTYQAGFEAGKALDLFGNRMNDSLFKITFVTVNPDTLGQVSGKVKISDNSYVSAQVVVEAVGTGNAVGKTYRKVLKGAGEYRFVDLLPGKYTIGAFVDLNGNSKLDLGNPFPFVPSEPKTVYPDTITVRSRWETESVDLSF